jgi:hypothetical protein
MKYMCPECGRGITTLGGIVLIGESKGVRTLFEFDMRPGHFGHDVADPVEFKAGETWEFSCPVCGKNLTADFNPRLARLEMMDGLARKRVLFSKVVDEHATFILGGTDLEAHGEHADYYVAKKPGRV